MAIVGSTFINASNGSSLLLHSGELKPVMERNIFEKRNILISRDTNYTRLLQLRNTLVAIRMHPAKKLRKRKRPATTFQT
jgi:hypothetical protein